MRLALSSIQWAIFILSGSLVAPIVIASAFGLSITETGALLQRTIFIIGGASLLQVLFGHKMPILEGPAGLWWGIFLSFSGLIGITNGGASEVLQGIELGLIVSGGLFCLLSIFRLVDKIKELFTPLVMGTYLILLVLQLSGTFIKGILGINYINPYIDFGVAIPAILTLLISILFSRSKIRFLKNYSVLLGIAFGWLLFFVLGLTKESVGAADLIRFPEIFSWGIPKFNLGIILTSLFTSLILLTNLIASIKVVEKALDKENTTSFNRSGMLMGINHMLAGLFSTIACVPNSHSAGFISTTGIKSNVPFIIGSSFLVVLSLFPVFTSFFSTLPSPVAIAVIIYPFMNMLGVGLAELKSQMEREQFVFITGLSLIIGVGTMFIPQSALSHIPSLILPLMNNGLIWGVLVCMIMEQFYKREKQTQATIQVSKPIH